MSSVHMDWDGITADLQNGAPIETALMRGTHVKIGGIDEHYKEWLELYELLGNHEWSASDESDENDENDESAAEGDVQGAKGMIPQNINELKQTYELMHEEIESGVGSTEPTVIDLAEYRGTGIYLFYGGNAWKFPLETDGDYYITIPLWHLHEMGVLATLVRNGGLALAVECSGCCTLSLTENIEVSDNQDGCNTIFDGDRFKVVSTNRDRSKRIPYDQLTKEDLLECVIQVVYGTIELVVERDRLLLGGEEFSLSV